MRTLQKDEIIDVIWGATLYGGGGGGSMKNGMDLLNKYEKDHPGKPIKIDMIGNTEMAPGSYAAVTAGMGAPTAIKDVDFSKYATNAYNALKDMAAKMDDPKKLAYSMAVELGGFNTFVPMLISLVNNLPFIDSDGAGRAVPALDTLLLHINGMDTSPLAMANGNDDRVSIILNDPRDAHLAEDIGRNICVAFNMMSGLAGWMISSAEINDLPAQSISKCQIAGKHLRAHAGKGDDLFEYLRKNGIECKSLGRDLACVVEKAETKQANGFDYGVVTIKAGSSDTITIYFQNENLLLKLNEKPVMTVPDIISIVNSDTGEPLTNADIKEGMKVFVGLMKVDQKWWQNPHMFDYWKPFLKNVGYDGPALPYSKLSNDLLNL
jgi:DUF917 family protein